MANEPWIKLYLLSRNIFKTENSLTHAMAMPTFLVRTSTVLTNPLSNHPTPTSENKTIASWHGQVPFFFHSLHGNCPNEYYYYDHFSFLCICLSFLPNKTNCGESPFILSQTFWFSFFCFPLVLNYQVLVKELNHIYVKAQSSKSEKKKSCLVWWLNVYLLFT